MQHATPSVNRRQRKILSTACNACRRRKIRCDGDRPTCGPCNASENTVDCVYDYHGDKRRLYSKRFVQSAIDKAAAYDALVDDIKRASDDAAYAIFSEIRNTNVVRRDKQPVTDDVASDEELSSERDDLTFDTSGEIHAFGAASNLTSIRKIGDSYSFSLELQKRNSPSFLSPSSAAYQSDAMTSLLLDLYWCWQHPYFRMFEKDLFLRDMESGGRFFSPFLLCSILAHASHYSDHSLLRSDPNDPSTAGYRYYAQAKDYLDEEMKQPSLTTVQGLAILASREAGIGMDSRGWIYSGMAFRIALDLGLHLDCSNLVEAGLLNSEDVVARKTTFWGCYIYDQGWSVYLGRPPLIPKNVITVEQFTASVKEPEPWRPVDPNGKMEMAFSLPYFPDATFSAIASLMQILAEIHTVLYHTRRKMRKTEALQFLSDKHGQLMNWYSDLPSTIRERGFFSMPAVLMVHAMFQTIIILLFRPLSKSNLLLQQGTTPLSECIKASEEIVALLQDYHLRFGLRQVLNLATHIVFTAATTFLKAYELDRSHKSSLDACLMLLDEIGQVWPSARVIRDGLSTSITSLDSATGTNEVSLAAPGLVPLWPQTSENTNAEDEIWLFGLANWNALLGNSTDNLNWQYVK